MATVKVSAKGWIVIPQALRDRYGLKKGARVQVVDYGGVLALAAAHLKAHHSIAYADAFAAALALQSSAVLVTGDPEFRHLEDVVEIHWLPR